MFLKYTGNQKRSSIRWKIYLLWIIVIVLSVIFTPSATIGLLFLTPVAFFQNMFFTWVSRSRQSGDPDYHRYAAWGSNGVWLLTQGFIAANVYTPISDMVKTGITADSIIKIVLTFIIYALATTEGSVTMMRINLGHYNLPGKLNFLIEKGKRQVGKR